MRRALILILVVATISTAIGAGVWISRRQDDANTLVLYGNVDLREVLLAFNGNERIAEILVEEGDRVEKGDLVARMDTSRLVPQVNQARAQVDAHQQAVLRMHNGTRPEEIAQARANLELSKANANFAEREYERAKKLVAVHAASVEDFDNATDAWKVARSRLEVNQKALELALVGPRIEDVKEAEASLAASNAQLNFLEQQLADAELFAPSHATVRSRLLEPGEMASPARPVLSLGVTDPKWVRAYVQESDLAHVKPGLEATITVDGLPDRKFPGWIGFVSDIAEFTPKTVQTTELRTSLVYEVRAYVDDPNDLLRLGMPATVTIALADDEVPSQRLRRQEIEQEKAKPAPSPTPTTPPSTPHSTPPSDPPDEKSARPNESPAPKPTDVTAPPPKTPPPEPATIGTAVPDAKTTTPEPQAPPAQESQKDPTS